MTQLLSEGRGIWRLNKSLLQDQVYKAEIREMIEEARISNGNKIHNWEWLKYKVKRISAKYAKQKKCSMENKLRLYDKKLAQYNDKLLSMHDNKEQRIVMNKKELLQQIQKIGQDCDELIAHKTKGAIVRAQSNYHLYGEKSSKYFFSMENVNYKRKNRFKIRKDSGNMITDNMEILKEQDKFFKALYQDTSDFDNEKFEEFVSQLDGPKLSEIERDRLEADISMIELRKAVFELKKDKVCGSDGLPIEFYQEFFEDIKELLLAVCQAIAKEGMYMTAKQGIIALIEKEGKNLDYLTNWHPLSLLNCDTKIYAKILAKRLDTVAQELIHTDQSGFLKGRLIHENLLDLASIIDYTEDRQIPGMIISFDFKKAFDTINWDYLDSFLILDQSLENHSKSLRVSNAHKNAVSCTINCGQTNEYFEIKQGLRQGSPLSPVLLDLAVELLGMAIRNNKEIGGIKIGKNYSKKHSQYADDLWASLDGTQESLDALLLVFDKFAAISGLKINYDKTQVFRTGSHASTDIKYRPDKPLQWCSEITVLGVKFMADKAQMCTQNFEIVKKKMEMILTPWKARGMTLVGKILIVNSLLMSQAVYKLFVLTPDVKWFKMVKGMVIKFLWEDKKPKIAYDTLIKDKGQGGLNLVDLQCKSKALKITWL